MKIQLQRYVNRTDKREREEGRMRRESDGALLVDWDITVDEDKITFKTESHVYIKKLKESEESEEYVRGLNENL